MAMIHASTSQILALPCQLASRPSAILYHNLCFPFALSRNLAPPAISIFPSPPTIFSHRHTKPSRLSHSLYTPATSSLLPEESFFSLCNSQPITPPLHPSSSLSSIPVSSQNLGLDLALGRETGLELGLGLELEPQKNGISSSDFLGRRSLMASFFFLFSLGEGSMAEAKPPPPEPELVILRSFTTPGGVRVQEVLEGSGPDAHAGDIVQFNYVCRRSNGYYVYSTVDPFNGDSQPVQFPLGEGTMIAGLEEVLDGMKAGGKRRALVPPSMGYINKSLQPQPQEFGPLRALFSHSGEPLVFEIQLLKIK